MSENKTDHLAKYVSILYRQGAAFLSKKYSKFDIGSGQYMFMIHLYKNDGISQEKLSEILNIDKGTTAKALKKLQELNYITRTKDENDKRINKIYVTDKALGIRDEFFQILDSWESTLATGLSSDEINLSLDVLKKLCENITEKEVL